MNHSHNLIEPLERVTASYGSTRPHPLRTVAVTQRADQLAAWAALGLDEPEALKNLQDAAAELRDVPRLAAVLPRIAGVAMRLMGAEFGTIQVVDPRDDALILVTQSGFRHAFLDHFAVVRDSRSVCGRAARQGAQAVTADVRDEPVLTPHQRVFRAAGVRSVQSTPLVDRAGRLIGMVSTHQSQPGRPSERELRVMELYGLLAGETIARHLAGGDVAGHPAGLPHDGTRLDRPMGLVPKNGTTRDTTHWAYRVDEPYGPEGCRSFGVHPDQWRGRITTDSPGQDAVYAASLVARELIADWDVRGVRGVRVVHVHVWRGWEDSARNAAFTLEFRPGIDGARRPAAGPEQEGVREVQ
ncbi:GAF domain-containing protein [Streptomyces sp. NPDC004629]|uniref:GAF domain-containing protein n=1 Tax=Streptomyces sp. NPDC004629 TaxID=3364705 RepID=UPI0036A780B2